MQTTEGLDALARLCEERGLLFEVMADGHSEGYDVRVWFPFHDEPMVDVTEIDALTAGAQAYRELKALIVAYDARVSASLPQNNPTGK